MVLSRFGVVFEELDVHIPQVRIEPEPEEIEDRLGVGPIVGSFIGPLLLGPPAP